MRKKTAVRVYGNGAENLDKALGKAFTVLEDRDISPRHAIDVLPQYIADSDAYIFFPKSDPFFLFSLILERSIRNPFTQLVEDPSSELVCELRFML